MATIIPPKLDEFRAYRPSEPRARPNTDAEKLKPVDNGVSEIRFFAPDAAGHARPYLKAIPSPTEDPKKLETVLDFTPEELAAAKDAPAKFEELLKAKLETRKDYLWPTKESLGVTTEFKLNHIVGLRVAQVTGEARRLAESLSTTPESRDAALRAANIAGRELYFGREIKFDSFNTANYASYGHDDPFVHVYELQLRALSAADPTLLTPAQTARVETQKRQLKNELDAIFRDKYVYHSGDMRELDAERVVGLVHVDRVSGQRVSEKESTASTIVPQFEVLSATVAGEKKAVYFDAKQKKYFLDGTGTELPADHGAIERKDVAANAITYRRARRGEPLREDFRFDWNRDGYVQRDSISWVGWAGHCNDKAALEAAGVVLSAEHPGVTVYDSASGKQAHFDRDLLNEILFSFSELGTEMSDLRSRPARDVGQVTFAGARDDDRPDQLVLNNAQRRRIPLADRPNKFTIQQVTIAGVDYPAERAFSRYNVAEDQLSAEPNPLFHSEVEGDVIQLQLGGAKVKASAEIQVFDVESGYPTYESKEIELDFTQPNVEPILIDTQLSDPAAREIYEITLAAKDGAWSWNYQLFRMEKPEGKDKYEKVAVEGSSGSDPFNPASVIGRHETSLDGPEKWLPWVDDAMKTGVNGTAETADGEGVWNGKMHTLAKNLVERKGDWEKVSVDVAAEFGQNTGEYLAKLNAQGEPEHYVPLSLPSDFFWRQQIVFAPEDGALVNTKALQRGVVTTEGGAAHTEALTDFMELLQLAFAGKPYSVLHNGERFVFDKKEDFEPEVAALHGLRSAVFVEAPPAPVRLEPSGALKPEEKVVLEPVTVPEDCMVKIELLEGAHAVTAEVKAPGQASGTKHSINRWGPKALELAAEKGETVHIELVGEPSTSTPPNAEEAKPYRVLVTTDASKVPDTRVRRNWWD